MPVATSSMFSNAHSRRQLTRELWSTFRFGAMKARRNMEEEVRTALMAARSRAPRGHLQEQQRTAIAKEFEIKYFFSMRSEWDRILRDNGLELDDWGDVTPQEMAAICTILGPPDLDVDEESPQPEIEDAPQIPLSHPPFEPAPPAPQPLSQSISHQSQSSVSSQYSFSSANASYGAPSLYSRSQNTSSAGYARIDPRNFTDDERNDSFGQMYGRNGSDPAIGGDEDQVMHAPSYQTWEREGQQPMYAHPPSQGLVNQNSLSNSPADYPMSRSYHHQPSSSLSSVPFPPQSSSSHSKAIPAEIHDDDDADRLFMPAPGRMPAASSTYVAANFAAASATAAKPKSKLRSEYIGPQLTVNDSENEADADFASMSKADQVAAYKKFKCDVRVQKIREFHNEAAELDIELASRIDQVMYDKAATAQMIAQHAQDMAALQHRKEDERKSIVDNERSRMKAEIRKVRPGASGKAQKKKNGATPASMAKVPPNRESSPHTFPASSLYNTVNTQTPPVSAGKPKTLGKSSPAIAGFGSMNLDGLQSVFDTVPDVNLDTAFQISQLIQGSGDVPGHQTSYDSEWNTPQPNPAQHNAHSTSNLSSRKRTESISVLGDSDSRFGTLSAKKGRQRGGTITAQTPTEVDNNQGMFWKPQVQTASPDESRLLTDQYAQFFLGGEGPANPANMRSTSSGAAAYQGDEEYDWVGWDQQPASKTSGAGKAKAMNSSSTSAWTTKKPTHAAPVPPGSSSPSMGPPSGWGASVRKTFGFGGGNNAAVEEGEQWETWGQEGHTAGMAATVKDGEEREELPRRSPLTLYKKPSILSDMMAKGRNAVAGAVGAALAPMGMNGSSPTMPSQQFPSKPPRKNSSAASTIPLSTPVSYTNPPMTATGKKAAKKTRQGANKQETPIHSTNQEYEETYEQPETQPHMLTPRAAGSSTKFTSTFGSGHNASASTHSGFGSPTSRSGVPTGGIWDDMSTAPQPNVMSGTFGGRVGNVRRPSGLHQEVWHADEEEEEEVNEYEQEEEEKEEEEEEETGENEWSMPGSLNPRGPYRPGASVPNSTAAWGAPTTTGTGRKMAAQHANKPGTWGRSSTITSGGQSAPFASATGQNKGLRQPTHARVTMEEILDESEDKSNRSPSDFLATDSRYVMEPKPSKPAAAFDHIIHYGEGASPEDMRHRPVATNKRSSPSKAGADHADDEFYDEEWYRRAAKQLQQETAKGNRLFGEQSLPGGVKSTQPQQTNSGMNVPGRGGSGPRANNNIPWGTPSSIPAHMAGPISASFQDPSFQDSSPLSNGPPPRMSSAFGNNMGASQPSSYLTWGAGKPSTPNVGVGVGPGKTLNTKAKPTTGTSDGFGTSGGLGWASATMSGHSHTEDGSWGQDFEQTGKNWDQQNIEQEQQRTEEILESQRKLKEMFDDSGHSSKPGKVPTNAMSRGTTTAKLQREMREREERERAEREQQEREEQEREAQEREEYEAQEREEREAREKEEQEKAAQEAKVKATAATKSPPQPKTTGGGKKGKGKKK